MHSLKCAVSYFRKKYNANLQFLISKYCASEVVLVKDVFLFLSKHNNISQLLIRLLLLFSIFLVILLDLIQLGNRQLLRHTVLGDFVLLSSNSI